MNRRRFLGTAAVGVGSLALPEGAEVRVGCSGAAATCGSTDDGREKLTGIKPLQHFPGQVNTNKLAGLGT